MMLFGLCGAPALFQGLMDHLQWGLKSCVAAYLDDIIIHSDSWEEHRIHIIAVRNRLKKAGLILKCHFAMKESVHLGHAVGNGVVYPELNKVEALEQFPVPSTTKKQVRQFLGLAGYYRRFIPEFPSQFQVCYWSGKWNSHVDALLHCIHDDASNQLGRNVMDWILLCVYCCCVWSCYV